MNDENIKDPGVDRGTFEETDFQPKLSKDQEQADRLQKLLSSVQQGWKIHIHREQPSWCRGTLETLEVYDTSEPIDTGYLIRTWGGHRLYIKVHGDGGKWIGGGSISLFSYPPRVHGKLIKEEDFFAQSPAAMPQYQAPYPNQAPAPAPQFDLRQLMELLQKGKKSELDLALKILDRAPAPQAAPQPVQQMGSMFEQMMSMVQVFGQMRDMFGGMSDGGSPSESESMTQMIGDVVKSLMQGNQNLQGDQRKGALVAPRVPGPPAPDHKVAELRPVQKIGDDTLSGIANKLSSLTANDAAEVVAQALGNMPENKRSEAMQMFFGTMSGNDDLDGTLNNDDTYDQEDESDDTTIEDHKTSNTGK